MNRLLPLLIVISGLAACSVADKYGTFIGNLTQNDKGVRGMVYVVDNSKIRIRHFYYSGEGPDAYFYMGRKSGSASPSANGEIIPDESGSSGILDGYSNADVVLTLPSGVTVNTIQWLSIWCRQAAADFGSVVFPSSVTVPTTMSVGQFSSLAHGVTSSVVTVINNKQIMIENLFYDGLGPDAFFWVGKGSPDSNGMAIPDELGRTAKLPSYSGLTITLTLPGTMTIQDIDYLSIWCKQAVQNFGNVQFSSNMAVIPYTSNIEGYYGNLIGDLSELAHNVRGAVYIVDDNRIRIRNFYYDGLGPDTFFWLGSSASPDDSGMMIPDENGMSAILREYNDADIVLTIPPGQLDQATWLSIWCKNFAANFGDLYFPKKYRAPAPVSIGEFSRLAHGLRSGTVTILDMKTIRIENLFYDGQGPDAFFWIGYGSSPSRTGWIVPDENGSTAKLAEYRGKTVTLTLPEEFSFMTVRWLSVWCRDFTQDFGHVIMPQGILLPPMVEMGANLGKPLGNCEQMDQYFNVAWEIEGDFITFEFQGSLDSDNNAMGYMSFGLSGSSSSSSMGGADVFTAFYDSFNGPMVWDYKLTAYSQCSGNQGACPDTVLGGKNDSMEIDGFEVNGITTIRFKRLLNTNDSNDTVIPTNGDVYIVWAMGRLSVDGYVTKHNQRLIGNKKLNFGRAPMLNCPIVQSRIPPVMVDPWVDRITSGMTFRARIGPAGPENQGYAAITNQQSWGIAWYLNGELIPEIEVVRGVEYTFIVEGGDDPTNSAKYHPFYITDDPIGGYVRKSESERALDTIYGGIDASGNPTAAGRYCEFETSTSTSSKTNYREFLDSLQLKCVAGQPATFKWTPDSNTPDLVYYQCYTHRYLGWKIVVRDTATAGSRAIIAVPITIISVLVVSAVIGRVFFRHTSPHHSQPANQ